MTLITEQNELEVFCNSIKNKKFITVDTEFLRDKTYYSKLCLIQIADDEKAVAIDPLSKNIDLTSLFSIFDNSNILKIFHSARQDLEIILNLTGKIPKSVFDTQIAAMVCGFGDSVSYETLVNKLLNTALDKSCRYSDWSIRPLNDRQISYALGDVTYLRDVYRKLNAMLHENNRAEWIEDEIALLINPETYKVRPSEMWKKIRIRSKEPKFLHLVQVLSEWREIKAQKLNIPRGYLLKDEPLLEIAAYAPVINKDLSKIRGLNAKIIYGELGSEIVQLIKENKGKSALYKEDFKYNISDNDTFELLLMLLKIKSEKENIAERLIISKNDLKKFAIDKDLEESPITKGWRYEVFGRDAEKIKDGKLAIAVKNNKFQFVDL